MKILVSYNKHIVATFIPQGGNGWTNGQMINLGLPSIFMAPNDSEAMAPDFVFFNNPNKFKAVLQKLLTDRTFALNYSSQIAASKSAFNLKCFQHPCI